MKSQDKKKSGAGASKGKSRTKAAAAKTVRPMAPSTSAATPDVTDAAIGLIEAAGGLDGARAALERLERLRGML